MAKYCRNCGALVPDGYKFCPECGTKQTADEPVRNTSQRDDFDYDDDFDFDEEPRPVKDDFVRRNTSSSQSNRTNANRNMNRTAVPPKKPVKKKSNLAPLIWGIVAIVFSVSPLGIILGIIGAVISIIAINKEKPASGKTIAGMVMSILAVVLSIVSLTTGGGDTTNKSDNGIAVEKTEDTTDNSAQETVVEQTTQPVEPTGPSKTEIMDKCIPLVYSDLARNPDAYVGQYFTADLSIFMVEEGGMLDGYKRAYRCYTESDYGWMGDLVILTDNRDSSTSEYTKLLEGDIIRVYGRFDKMMQMKNFLNGAVSEEVCLEVLYADILSGGGGSESEEVSVTDSDFDIKEYIFEDYFSTDYYLVVTNNSDETVSITGNATAKDANGNVIGAGDIDIKVIGPHETTLGNFYFSDVKDVASVDYQLSYSKAKHYAPAVGNLSLDYNVAGENVVVTVTNNGELAANFVEAYGLFFDSNGKLVSVDRTYVIDDNSKITPGATISGQLHSYESFDHVEVYLTARTDK